MVCAQYWFFISYLDIFNVNEYKILIRTLEGKDHLGELDTDGSIILKWIVKK
jgi:hypothetical protein